MYNPKYMCRFLRDCIDYVKYYLPKKGRIIYLCYADISFKNLYS